MRLIGAQYRGGGTRPDVPCRDLDLAMLRTLTRTQIEVIAGSDLFTCQYADSEGDPTPLDFEGDVAPADVATAADAPTGLAGYAALKARAKELGLAAKGKADELAAAIAAKEAELAIEGGGADVPSADDPDGSDASEEADEPPTGGEG